jgi:hypothetical protein
VSNSFRIFKNRISSIGSILSINNRYDGHALPNIWCYKATSKEMYLKLQKIDFNLKKKV